MEMQMLVANYESVDTSAPDVAEDLKFMRGLLYAIALSVPLWGAIIGLAQLAL
jgi:hypothetical protein